MSIIIATSTGATMEQEEFNVLGDCLVCGGSLVRGALPELRVDHDTTENQSKAVDPDSIGVKITTDLVILVCTQCGWSAASVESTAYAGY